jgi:hypothetical protein
MHTLTLVLYFVAVAAFVLALLQVPARISWIALGLLAWVIAAGLIPTLT